MVTSSLPLRQTRLLIIGGGPAGYTAAIYGARSGHETLLTQGPQPGGQLTITTDVDNYPGFAQTVQGPDLMTAMKEQAERMGAQMAQDTIVHIERTEKTWHARGENALYQADAVIIATGAQARWLGLESETTFRGHGVSACATCDGFFFRGQNVAVVGGGNTAVEEALFLAHMGCHVTLIHRRDQLRAERVLQDKLLNTSNITLLWHHTVEEIEGTEKPKEVTGVRVRHTETGQEHVLSVQGIFIAIGHVPMTKVFRDVVNCDNEGYILTKPGSTQTSQPGLFAAGDVQDKVFRQAITAAGQGCMAALEADQYLGMTL